MEFPGGIGAHRERQRPQTHEACGVFSDHSCQSRATRISSSVKFIADAEGAVRVNVAAKRDPLRLAADRMGEMYRTRDSKLNRDVDRSKT